MTTGSVTIAFYGDSRPADIVDTALDACAKVGFDVEAIDEEDRNISSEDDHEIIVSLDDASIRITFPRGTDDPEDPIMLVGRLDDKIHERWTDDEESYRRWMDIVFELTCRLATAADASYVALFNSANRGASVLPDSEPIGDAIETPPRLGIYSNSVLADLGGVPDGFDEKLWYHADIDSERTVVIEADAPWTTAGWEPPSRAPYIESAKFHERGDETTDLSLTDPFNDLSSGNYGTDVCVAREDIAAEFRNEDLQLIRVSVDENRDLRRIDDDTFVRNVVDTDFADDDAVIQAQLDDIPAAATEDDLMVSALLHDAIPPSFVRLDDLDDETVVSRVMNLDVDTNKVELLISLGRAAQHEDGVAVETIEAALDSLADLDGVDGVDQWIEDTLL